MKKLFSSTFGLLLALSAVFGQFAYAACPTTVGTQTCINRGTTAGDGTGETLFTAFGKVNSNFTDLYSNYATQFYSTKTAFPATGVATTLYVANDTGMVYQWLSAAYSKVGVLGSTPSALVGGIDTPSNSYGFQTLAALVPNGTVHYGLGNNAFGYQSQQNTGTGAAAYWDASWNNSFGAHTLWQNTTGNRNNAFGDSAMMLTTTGTHGTAIGDAALSQNTSGSYDTAVGANALYGNLTGNSNVAVGASALQANTSASFLVGVGASALQANTTGTGNVAVGSSAGLHTTTGGDITAVGFQALGANTTGGAITAIGSNALANLNTNYGTAVGAYAFYSTTGTKNAGIGANTGYDVTSGDSNTLIGNNTGRGITTGRANTVIGANITGLAATLSNTIILGDGDGAIRLQAGSNGILNIETLGGGLAVKEGLNGKQGVVTLTAGAATVSTTAVTANSRIFLTSQVDGGTPGFLRVSARTAGTSFTITSSSGTDTSTVAYEIVEPAQ